MSKTYKSQGKKGLFDEQFAVSHLSEMGNPIESISKVIDFEMFRAILESRLQYHKEKQCRSQAF